MTDTIKVRHAHPVDLRSLGNLTSELRNVAHQLPECEATRRVFAVADKLAAIVRVAEAQALATESQVEAWLG